MEIIALSPANFKDFIYLLSDRNIVPLTFYQWKFISTADAGKSSGYIAFKDNKPIGCIGKINRMILDKEGIPFTATWFSDWYTAANARGTGVGKALMSEVAHAAEVGLGIPGPSHAQQVAQKAGYRVLPGFVEVQIPLSPFKFGYRMYNGAAPMKLLRAARELLYAFRAPTSQHINHSIINGFPVMEKWIDAVQKGLKNKVYLQRDEAFLNWFKKLPSLNDTDRQWWSYSNHALFAAGFSQTDKRGLKIARVMECICLDKNGNRAIYKLLNGLKNAGNDQALLLLSGEICEELNLPKRYMKNLPVHITAKASIFPDYLSLMDKESSWMDIQFK